MSLHFLSIGELAERLGLERSHSWSVLRASWALIVIPPCGKPCRRISAAVSDILPGCATGWMICAKAGDIFEKVTVAEIDYLTEALQTVDRTALDQAVTRMITCDHIYVFGTGPSISLVHLLNLRLTRFGKQVITLTLTGRETLEPLLLMTERDLLFAIGFFDINPALQIVLDFAREVNCPAILLTDTLGSIVGDKVDIVLAAKRGPVSAFHSLVVPMTIINTLFWNSLTKTRKL